MFSPFTVAKDNAFSAFEIRPEGVPNKVPDDPE
jgi:hypothetical protein